MAASAKRKQEEKHLKMLREMTSLPPNRKCFDCDQRGPTYANMTVGSFVCTSCSGILRGLNPPHRVKSISMTTFTQQEIEYLQKHGNEVCKQIWLSLYDDRTTSVPDFREPQKVKEFLQEKYEKKRWHVPPEQAKPAAPVHASISGSSNSSTSSTPRSDPSNPCWGSLPPPCTSTRTPPPNQSPVVSRGQSQQQQPFHDKRFDLLSELGGDIFAAPPNMNAGASSSFANFAHFNSHTRAGLAAGGGSAGVGGPPQRQPGVPAGCDRYAALAELDTVFGPSVPPTSVYNPTSTSQGRSVFGSESGMSAAQAQQALPGMAQGFGAQSTNPFVAAPAAPPTNPFQSNGRTAHMAAAAAAAAAASFGTGSMSMPAGFGNVAAFNLPTSFSGTFQQPFPGQAPFPQPPAYPQQPNGGGFAAFGQAKPVGTPFGQTMSGPMISSNPFLGAAPSAQYPAGGSSTNPFL
ncbi:arf-GAP domain and FG repeat-containing protein 1a isoform X4 [Pseudochaenichthys georgianus]|uniref:arf-GAP domain and FG repeat-containing protein 1a isoform X4 n=1 Tax=Pseudochaenichthys georgianus TaxID=52239 RepID=UPI00146D02E4|nr:arf-GAP domain and FG repeat-containing protein 1a isoform X4 [Pseudochaenichthys georgianus]